VASTLTGAKKVKDRELGGYDATFLNLVGVVGYALLEGAEDVFGEETTTMTDPYDDIHDV